MKKKAYCRLIYVVRCIRLFLRSIRRGFHDTNWNKNNRGSFSWRFYSTNLAGRRQDADSPRNLTQIKACLSRILKADCFF